MRTITTLTLKMLQVRANRMSTRISFFSKTVREIRAFFLSMTKIQLKRVNHKLSRRTFDAPSTGRFREASSGPEKSLVQHGFVEKKKRQTSWRVEGITIGLEIGLLTKIAFWSLLKVQSETDLWVKIVRKKSVAKLV